MFLLHRENKQNEVARHQEWLSLLTSTSTTNTACNNSATTSTNNTTTSAYNTASTISSSNNRHILIRKHTDTAALYTILSSHIPTDYALRIGFASTLLGRNDTSLVYYNLAVQLCMLYSSNGYDQEVRQYYICDKYTTIACIIFDIYIYIISSYHYLAFVIIFYNNNNTYIYYTYIHIHML